MKRLTVTCPLEPATDDASQSDLQRNLRSVIDTDGHHYHLRSDGNFRVWLPLLNSTRRIFFGKKRPAFVRKGPSSALGRTRAGGARLRIAQKQIAESDNRRSVERQLCGEEKAMLEADRIAAAILACEASRQHQKMIKAGPGRLPTDRDIAGELWCYFKDFLGRLERESAPTR